MDTDARLLTYDNLPPFSTIRREQDGKGGVLITVPAEEPTPYVKRAAARREALISAVFAAGVLVLSLSFFGPVWMDRRLFLPWWAGILFGVFCAAIFAFIWFLRYRARLAMIERALQQMTILSISPQQIVIESKGPFGEQSLDIKPGELLDIRLAQTSAGVSGTLELNWLLLDLAGAAAVQILPGREPEELRWIARNLRQAADQEI